MEDLRDIFSSGEYTLENGFSLPYRYYIPETYDAGEKYPLVLFMHGAGERGHANWAQLMVGLPALFGNPSFPKEKAIVIAPHCPPESKWTDTDWGKGNYSVDKTEVTDAMKCVLGILTEISASCSVDRDRIYVTGLSMGGFAAWDLLVRQRGLFAAGMPVCGGGDPAKADILREVPIRTFHGDEDDCVPPDGTREMAAAITGNGTVSAELFSYTEIAGGGHDIWDTVYADPGNVAWLFAQSKKGSQP